MKNLWPDAFETASIKSVKTLLTEQSAFLNKITGGIVEGEVVEVNAVEKFQLSYGWDEFNYKFMLVGRFIDNYKFNVFYFWHDIGLYPVFFNLDEQLCKEMKISVGVTVRIDDEAQVEVFLTRIFSSQRMKRVIGSMMSLSK